MLPAATAARPPHVTATSLLCASAHIQRHCCRRLVSSSLVAAACSGAPAAAAAAAAQGAAAQRQQGDARAAARRSAAGLEGRAMPVLPQHYAVVGAGLAGLATVYHLLKLTPPGRPVRVTLFDAVGLGAGGSGAAAGLLHPYAPTGKLLWRAHEAMAAAVELLEAAEAAEAARASSAAAPPQQIAWRTGMLRPAANLKVSQAYWKQQQQAASNGEQQQAVAAGGAGTTARLQAMLAAAAADASTAQQLLPGVQLPVLAIQQQQTNGADQQQQQQQAAGSGRAVEARQRPPCTPPAAASVNTTLQGWTPAAAAALHIPGGITLQPLQYLHALWGACQAAAAARDDGSSAVLHIQQLRSLQELLCWQQETGQQQQQVVFDAIVVAAGAAIGSLAEFSQEQLPLSLCQGYTLEMVPDDASSAAAACASKAASEPAAAAASSRYPAAAPSLLGAPYLASQGGARLLVGATKDHDWSSAQALAELGRCIDPAIVAAAERQLQLTERQGSSAEVAAVAAAAAELLAGAAAGWPPLARGWRIAAVTSGVRALPRRNQLGAVPLLGKWGELARPEGQQEQQQQQAQAAPHSSGDARGDTTRRVPVWLFVGLGARGLVYHAWLGQLTAAAVVSGSEGGLPSEVLGWRSREA